MFTLGQKLAEHKMRFEDQMKKIHDENEQNANIWPHGDWTIEDYECLFNYIERGYLVQSGAWENPHAFIINEEWEGDPLWEE